MSIPKLFFQTVLSIFLLNQASAQTPASLPNTPVTEVFEAWLLAVNSADRITIENYQRMYVPESQRDTERKNIGHPL